ncbi:hypothetical protein ACTPD5_21500, partial [Clostridioides difficile]
MSAGVNPGVLLAKTSIFTSSLNGLFLDLYSILLKQHVGGPDKPVVSVGDVVKKGTLIAEPTGLGANIYA